ncbi:MAG: hypothetical protein RLY69_768, partial [Verrucomicrobiota bacterium]
EGFLIFFAKRFEGAGDAVGHGKMKVLG